MSAIDLSCTIAGQTVELPLVLAPVGLAGIYARRGEVQAARAAAAAKVPYCLSTVGICSIEEVREAEAPFWFQLYMMRDRGFMRELLVRARKAGCEVLMFTVDMPVPGIRYRDHRTGLAGGSASGSALRRLAQAAARPRWAWDVGIHGRPHALGNIAPLLGRRSGINDFFGWMRDNFDPSVTWRDLEFVRAHWPGKVIIKGILDVDDARAAASAGADGIVVSNHGGRQLDGVVASAAALPPIAAAVGDQLELLVDGGVRSGSDVLKMLALGARAVMIGRPWVYALAAGGRAGLAHLLERFAIELRVAMALTGQMSVKEVGKDILAQPHYEAPE